MYSPRIEPDKVERLFKLKQMILATGEETSMVKLTDEALTRYLPIREGKVRKKLAKKNAACY